MERRGFMAALGGLALGGLALGAAWPRIATARVRARDSIAIDGAGGTGLFWYDPADPANAQPIQDELDAIRASGLTAVVLTLSPSGRFWMDDAAFEKTRAAFDNWAAIVARHPAHLTSPSSRWRTISNARAANAGSA